MELERPRPKPSSGKGVVRASLVTSVQLVAKAPQESQVSVQSKPMGQAASEPLLLPRLQRLVAEPVFEPEQEEVKELTKPLLLEAQVQEPPAFTSGVLAGGEQVMQAIYPDTPATFLPMSIRGNPLQMIRVDPQSFKEREVSWQASSDVDHDSKMTFEFEVLLRAYLTSLKEKQKIGSQAKLFGDNVEAICSEVWKMSKRSVLGRIVSGPIGQKVNVPPFEYEIMEFQKEVAQKLKNSMSSLRSSQLESSFNSTIAFLHVDTYIANFLHHSHLFSQVEEGSAVSFLHPSQRTHLEESEALNLRHMVQVMFIYYTQLPKQLEADAQMEFYDNLKQWLTKAVSHWHRVATYNDHLFILGQVITSRSISSWGSSFVQLPRSSQAIYDQRWPIEQQAFFLDMLKRLLLPLDSSLSDSQSPYVLLEEDFISLFRQFPFEEFINSVFNDGRFDRTYEIAYELVGLLSHSISRFHIYRHFIQRVADVIRCVIARAATYTSSILYHLDADMYRAQAQPIKTLFDGLFSMAFKRLFSQKSCGIWQFLVHFPYQVISTTTAYHLFNFMITVGIGSNACNMSMTAEAWMSDASSFASTNRQALAEILDGNLEEFLLLSWAKLVLGQDDENLGCIVIHEIFMLGFIVPETSSFAERVARNSLQEIMLARPHLLSFLITACQHHFSELGNRWQSVWTRMPLNKFLPTFNDLAIIEEWLGDQTYGEPHQLAKCILEGLNWKSDSSIPADVHTHVALVLSKKYTQLKEITTASQGLFRWNSTWKQFTQFKDWTLNFLLSLRQFNSSGLGLLQPISKSDPSIAFLGADTLSTAGPHDPVLAYVALLTTTIGRNPREFVERGFYFLHSLVISQNYISALRVVHDILGFVLDESLDWSSSGLHFVKDITYPLILQTDDNSVVSTLSSQLMKSYAENPELTRRLIGFWTGSIFRCEGWSQVCCLHDLSDEQNNRFLALLDVLIQFVYLMGFSSDFRPAFEESYQVEQTKAKSKSGWSFGIIVGGLVSGVKYVTGYWSENTTSIPYSFFSLETILTRIAEEKPNWLSFGLEVLRGTNPNLNLSQNWSLIEVANTCILLRESDPSAIIWWQLFFHLHFTYITPRIIEGTNEMVGGFFSHRVLSSGVIVKPVEQIKKRLTYVIEYHKLESRKPFADQEFHGNAISLYSAMIEWINIDISLPTSTPANLLATGGHLKPIIHTGDVDIRSALWIELLNKAHLAYNIQSNFKVLPWDKPKQEQHTEQPSKPYGTHSLLLATSTLGAEPNAPGMLLDLLKSNSVELGDSCHFFEKPSVEAPLPPLPLNLQEPLLKPHPVTDGLPEFIQAFENDIELIIEAARNHANTREKLTMLDTTYFMQLSKLYTNQETIKKRAISCGENSTSIVTVEDEITAWIKDTGLIRKLQDNRLVATGLVKGTTEDENVIRAIVRLELTVSSLASFVGSNVPYSSDAREKGSSIFYSLVARDSASVASFAPSDAFFTKYILKIAQNFICNDPTQYKRFLQAIFSSERTIALLTPIYEPNLDVTGFVDSVKEVFTARKKFSDSQLQKVFNQFNVAKWLLDCDDQPLQQKLLDEFGDRLTPSKHLDSGSPLWKPLLLGFKAVACHNFPRNYAPTLNFLFKHSKVGKLSPDVWEVTVGVLKENQLQSTQTVSIMRWIGEFTNTLRIQKQASMHEIWQNYVNHFCTLVQNIVNHVKVTDDGLQTPGASELVVSELLVNVFAPWMTPFSLKNSTNLSPAWPESLSSSAVMILSSFSRCLRTLNDAGAGRLYMNPIFDFLKEKIIFATAQPTHIQIPFRTQLVLFPWSDFTPYPSLPDELTGLLSNLLDEGRVLEYCMLVEIAWSIKWETHNIPPTQLSTYYIGLLTLLLSVTQMHPLPMPLEWTRFLFTVVKKIDNYCSYLPQDLLDRPMVKDMILKIRQLQAKQKSPEVPGSQEITFTLGAENSLESSQVKDEGARVGLFLRFLRNIIITGPTLSPRQDPSSQTSNLTHLSKKYAGLIVSLLPGFFSSLHQPDLVISDLINTVVKKNIDPVLDRKDQLFEIQEAPGYHILVHLLADILVLYNIQIADAPLELVAILENELKKFVMLYPYLGHVLLRATQLSITYPERLVNLAEHCLAYDFQHHQDWKRLVQILLVPELGRPKFLEKALESGAVLTLVTFAIQQELLGLGDKLQTDLVAWVKSLKVAPGTAAERNSLVLWEKATALTFGKCIIHPALHLASLEEISRHLIILSADYKTPNMTASRLLGYFNWSQEPSHYSVAMRLSARALGTFILSQLLYPVDPMLKGRATAIRKNPHDVMSQEPQLQVEINNLLALKKDKAYQEHVNLIQNVADFIQSPDKTLNDVHRLVLLLSSGLYHNDSYTRMVLQ